MVKLAYLYTFIYIYIHVYKYTKYKNTNMYISHNIKKVYSNYSSSNN